MKDYAVLALLLAGSAAWTQPPAHPVVLMEGLSALHHPVSTGNPEAQKFFDQGLRLVYAFNHDEAERSFRQAAELDPQLAMAWWGVALAVGPNYNMPVDPAREKLAVEAVDKARTLDARAPAIEQGYIEAMAQRFSRDPQPNYFQLNANYAKAMRELSRKYPDDLDAATLFADGLMNLHPWKLWKADGSPGPDTEEILATLESVRRRDPNHIGAVHLYIHAVEASPHPERALTDADRLAGLAPAAGHLVHMPAHIYARTGNFDGARRNNEAAARADEQFAALTGSQGMYMAMYYSHNLHFGAIAAAMEGHCAAAQSAAMRLADNVRPAVGDVPELDPFLGIPLAVEARCNRWDDLLAVGEPDASTPRFKAIWLYSRGVALAARGRIDEAAAMRQQLQAMETATPRDQIYMAPIQNHTWQIFHLAGQVLAARIAAAKQDRTGAIKLLRDAVATQDQLLYDEPADWYYPVRESLGGLLLQDGDVAGAEQIFRDDLERNPRNPRSLFGLAEALTRQHRDYEAGWVKQQFTAAWQGADIELKVAEL